MIRDEQGKLYLKINRLHEELVEKVEHIEHNDGEIGIKKDLILIRKIVNKLIEIYEGYD